MSEKTSDSEAARVVYDIEENERPSEAVVLAVSTLTNTPILELDPLFDTIDPEHLDSIVREWRDTDDENAISFQYSGCRISVTHETVRVRIDADR